MDVQRTVCCLVQNLEEQLVPAIECREAVGVYGVNVENISVRLTAMK